MGFEQAEVSAKLFGWNGTRDREVSVDAVTRALMVLQHEYHQVHLGHFYRAGMNYTLANGNVALIAMTTPNTPVWAHMTWDLSATADGTFNLLEDVTSYSGGAAVTPINHNRNSALASAMTCKRGMTGVDLIEPTGGTVILAASLATGKGSTVDRSHGAKFILKQNSTYIWRYTNGTSANIILLALEWYEHESKES